MNIKALLLCSLILTFASCQDKTCLNITCPQSTKCLQGVCQLDTLSLLNKYSPTNSCGNTNCQRGEVCRNDTCVWFGFIRARNNPPPPTESGVVAKAVCPYATYYAQENVYYLSRMFDKVRRPGVEGYVVFLVNEKEDVRVRQQYLGKKANKDNYKFAWNFHVIFIEREGKQARVLDFDSRLPWRSEFQDVWTRALKNQQNQPATLFRVIPYKKYLEYFASSRSSYKKTKADGTVVLRTPPPVKNPVVNQYNETDTLGKYVDINNKSPEYGQVMNADDFYKFFTS